MLIFAVVLCLCLSVLLAVVTAKMLIGRTTIDDQEFTIAYLRRRLDMAEQVIDNQEHTLSRLRAYLAVANHDIASLKDDKANLITAVELLDAELILRFYN